MPNVDQPALSGGWFGGVWNGPGRPFSEPPTKCFQRLYRNSLKFRRKSVFFFCGKSQAQKLKDSEPENMQFHSPSHSIRHGVIPAYRRSSEKQNFVETS